MTPILATELPTTGAFRRFSDQRIRQFWDKYHVVAQTLAESGSSSRNQIVAAGTEFSRI
jgi:hypothetical protein